jgi:hypothetical protein
MQGKSQYCRKEKPKKKKKKRGKRVTDDTEKVGDLFLVL